MKNKPRKILPLLFLIFTIASFGQNKTIEDMEWLTNETEYDGLPLYLRLPNYKNVWKYKSIYPKLICITHEFDNVKDNGLPKAEYNESLIDFDGEIVSLFDPEKNGIVFLVETYGGARNYWFYSNDVEIAQNAFKKLQNDNSEKILELNISNDSEWVFLKKYPVQLYKSE